AILDRLFLYTTRFRSSSPSPARGRRSGGEFASATPESSIASGSTSRFVRTIDRSAGAKSSRAFAREPRLQNRTAVRRKFTCVSRSEEHTSELQSRENI